MLDEAVGQGGFTVVDVGNDRKIADVIHGGHSTPSRQGMKNGHAATCPR
jgi:hypothetical protein